jgi:rhodanese-related sulfurtransferase
MDSETNQQRRYELQRLIDRDIKFDNVENISAKQATELENVLFVDVRSKSEFLTSAIPNAVHRAKFESMLLEKHNQEISAASVICFYCTVGVRSAKYVRWLKQDKLEGLTDKTLVNMKGSILDWCHEPNCAPLVKPSNSDIAVGPAADEVHCFGNQWCLAPTKYHPVTFSLFEQLAEGAKWSPY